MASSFIAYVDESGDEGFQFSDHERGSSRWFVLSAVVFRSTNERCGLELVKEARQLLGKKAGQPLHFRDLKHEQRVPYAEAIGNAVSHMRTISVLMHKPSCREPETFQSARHRLYRYATRLLVERVSWLCRDHRKQGEGDGTVEMIFSNRSAMSYDDLRDYLTILKADAEHNSIDWNVIDPAHVQAVNHEQRAGLQIADAVASGFFQGINRNPYGGIETRYAEALLPTLYRYKGKIEGYGLKFWPSKLAQLIEDCPQLGQFPELK